MLMNNKVVKVVVSPMGCDVAHKVEQLLVENGVAVHDDKVAVLALVRLVQPHRVRKSTFASGRDCRH